jgi:FdhE protein
MTSELGPNQAAKRIENALNRIREDMPAAANLVDAFSELLIEKVRFKDELPLDEAFAATEIDLDRFRQGVPIADKESFAISASQLGTAAARLLPAMKKGFSKIEPELTALEKAVSAGEVDFESAVKNLLGGRLEELRVSASELSMEPEILSFSIRQLLKPFVEKRAESISVRLETLQWLKGYCPICGSWPMMSFLSGEEGKRWLKCSFCGHEWRYVRTACPFCENDDSKSLEYLYSEDRESERAEVCHKCKVYIVGMDLRQRSEETVTEVAPLGLVYLDIIAQQEGYRPGAVTDWNVIDKE